MSSSLGAESFGPTFVDGIGPPLEQLADDYAGEAWAPDFFALVTEIKRLRRMCGPRLDNPSASSGVLPDTQEGRDGGHTRYRDAPLTTRSPRS